jgi:hypothetical protein
MYDINSPSLVHAESTASHFVEPQDQRAPFMPAVRPAPTRGPLAGKLAWFSGLSLTALGAMGLNTDFTLAIFDSTSVAVGLLALPPVTNFVRARLPFTMRGWQHFFLAAAALGGAMVLNVSGVLSGGASYPVATNVRMQSFGVVSVGDPMADAERTAQQKADYLMEVAAQSQAMDREASLAADLGATDTEYDEQMISSRGELVSRRAAYTLTPEENQLIDKLASRVRAARAGMAPAMRRSYVEALNGPLATYGVSAHLVGNDVIEFVGPALADPQRRQAILNLTLADRARLGFADARFAGSEAASAQQNTPIQQDANVGPSAALEPQGDEAAAPAA